MPSPPQDQRPTTHVFPAAVTDPAGRSLRQRCFILYHRGYTFQQVVSQLPVNPETARRYYYQWRKLYPRPVKQPVRTGNRHGSTDLLDIFLAALSEDQPDTPAPSQPPVLPGPSSRPPPVGVNIQSRLVRLSKRRQSFLLFEIGHRPDTVSPLLGIKPETGRRYYLYWKKQLVPLQVIKYPIARTIFRKLDTNEKRIIAGVLAFASGSTPQAVMAHLRRPWSCRQIVTGQWRQWTAGSHKQPPFKSIRLHLRKLQASLYSDEVKKILELAFHPQTDLDPGMRVDPARLRQSVLPRTSSGLNVTGPFHPKE